MYCINIDEFVMNKEMELGFKGNVQRILDELKVKVSENGGQLIDEENYIFEDDRKVELEQIFGKENLLYLNEEDYIECFCTEENDLLN